MTKELTFNDLPMVVAQLRDEVVGMKQMIISLQSQNKPHKANTHIPMSVEEASAYLKMPMATLYMKLGNGHSCRKQAQAETLKLVISWMRLNYVTKSTWKPSF